MSGRSSSAGDQMAGETEPRSIPDGGLGEAMPDWLRRPPAWRHLEPKPPRTLPPADTSVIDPATLIAVEDLPAWLQAVARSDSVATEAPPAPPATSGRRVIPRVIEARRPPSQERREEHTEPAPEPETPTHVPLNLGHAAGTGPSSATIVFGTLLAVALVVILVLLWLLYA